MDNRKQKYYKLNTKISYLSDKDISELKKEKESTGWGKNAIVSIDNEKVFIKKIPLTKLEYDNQFDTANLYNVPVYNNYGVGSMGTNCYRELAMHVKTTNWVLNNDIDNFPLMYHYRIIKNIAPLKHFDKKDELEKYVKRWNNNENIKKYAIAKDNAEYEIVIFLEYFPYVLYDHLKSDAEQVTSYITQMRKTIDFLKKNNIIHFDAHVGNIVSDGTIFCLTDFGLVLDMDFNLTKQEQDFFKRNDHYDYSMVMSNIGSPLISQIGKEKEYFDKKYFGDAADKISEEEFYEIVHDNLDEICKYLKYDEAYVQLLKKYWDIMIIFPVYHYNMRHNNKKDDVFPNDAVKKLIDINKKGGGYYNKYQKYKLKYMNSIKS